MSRSLRLLLLALCVAWLLPVQAQSQDFGFTAPPSPDDPSAAVAMRDLAERMLPVYEQPNVELYLEDLTCLQIAVGNWAAAHDTRDSLRDHKYGKRGVYPVDRDLVFDLYIDARLAESTRQITFAQAYQQGFEQATTGISDADAAELAGWLSVPVLSLHDTLQQLFDRLRRQDGINGEDAIEAVRAWSSYVAYQSFGSLVGPLIAADASHRVVVEEGLQIEAPGGRRISAFLVRPRADGQRLPALLEFDLAPSRDQAQDAAAHGYVGVAATAPAGVRRPAGPLLFEHDGEDAAAVIDWIARQPWSDGRVGMVGDGYGGFAAWAAAARQPPALKAIAVSDALLPGVDFPAPGRIFVNDVLRWSLADPRAPAADAAAEAARWKDVDRRWYRSGKPYRQLPKLAGVRSPAFSRWLEHPGFDRYWQKLLPDDAQFAGIRIPVLSLSGYYAAHEASALYGLAQRLKLAPAADQMLLIGPYDSAALAGGVAAGVGGYAVDPAARLDLRELRLRWFGHVFGTAPLPVPLQQLVNYELMGANAWCHAASLEPPGGRVQRFYLRTDAAPLGLVPAQTPPAAPVALDVDFRDRSDAAWAPSPSLLGKNPEVHNGLVFESDPLPQALPVAGLLGGRLDFRINRHDVDLSVDLYERLASGDTLKLAQTYAFRASYLKDRSHRHLLRPGERQQLAFSSEAMAARRLQPGSRLLLVLSVVKRADREVDYGSGRAVEGESMADAAKPLHMEWFGSSYIELPLLGGEASAHCE